MNPMSQVMSPISRPNAVVNIIEKKVVMVSVTPIFVLFRRWPMVSSAASFFVIISSGFIGIPLVFERRLMLHI